MEVKFIVTRKLSLFLVLMFIFTFGLSTFASAAEVSDVGNSQVGSSIGMDDVVSNVDGEENGGDNGGESSTPSGSGDNGGSESDVTEPSETVSEPSEPSESPTEGSEKITVDVSEDSISAIADAVVDATNVEYQYAYQYYISCDDGVTRVIDTSIENLFDKYDVVIYPDSLGRVWVYCYSNFTTYHDGTSYVISSDRTRAINFSLDTNAVSFSSIGTNYQAPKSVTNFFFSSKHLFDSKTGKLIYASSVCPPIQYTISFVSGFSDLTIDSISADHGGVIVAPVPSYDGYKFDGWYFDADFTLPYSSDFLFTSDTSLYAKWIPYRTVSFVTNIEGFELGSVKVLSGSPYTLPTFNYSGYEYTGAFTDVEFQNQFIDGSVITDDITLYLNFSEIEYNIGGLVNELLNVAKGLDVIEAQLWIILVVGLLYFVYRFFRIFF